MLKRTLIRRTAIRRGGLSARERGELDRLARWVVMLRAGASLVTDQGREQWWGSCQRCGEYGWLSWCHVITRGAWSVRWDPLNAFAWCLGCHRWMDQHWEKKSEWVRQQLGSAECDALVRRSNGTKPDHAAARMFLQREVERLTGRVWE